jgi:hypothetical protein
MTLSEIPSPEGERLVVFGALEIPESEADDLSDAAIVRRLVAGGASHLTAERIVELGRSAEEPSRARRRRPAR